VGTLRVGLASGPDPGSLSMSAEKIVLGDRVFYIILKVVG